MPERPIKNKHPSNSAKIALIGAGHRGRAIYGKHIKADCPDLKITAVAEPNPIKRKVTAREHQISINRQFKSSEQLFQQNIDIDAAMITTMDYHHYYPILACIKKGYKALLEKPIAPTFPQLRDIVKIARQHNSSILIAHVLRYTPFYQKLKQLLHDGQIGTVHSINHSENVGYYHFVHSYVRGNWKNEHASAPLFLAKSSHDFDLFAWLLESNCKKVYSQGKQQHFTEQNHPPGAGKRCFQCSIEGDCPYSARHIYLDKKLPWPQATIEAMPPRYQRYLGVRFTNFGRCVYMCDNTMPEVLTASLTYENDVQVSFTLTGLSKEMNRITTIYGDRGEIRADFAREEIDILPYHGPSEKIAVTAKSGAHGGGDLGLMEHFQTFLQNQISEDTSTLEKSIESHLTALAAEQSRQREKVIYLRDYWQQLY